MIIHILDETSNFFKNVLHAKSVSGAVPQKEHGMHTVSVEFDNTKIEVKLFDFYFLKNKNMLLFFSSFHLASIAIR